MDRNVYRFVFEQLSNPIILFDSDLTVVDLNPAAIQLIDNEQNETSSWAGKSVQDLFHWIDTEILTNERDAAKKIYCEKESFFFEYRLKPLSNPPDTVVTMLSLTRVSDPKFDDADLQKSKEQLKKSELTHRTLAENLPGILYRVYLRENHRMEFYNDMLENLTGYTPDELIMDHICSIESIIVPEDRSVVTETLKKAIRDYVPFEVEYRIHHKNGQIRHFFERGRAIAAEDEEPCHMDAIQELKIDRYMVKPIKRKALKELMSELYCGSDEYISEANKTDAASNLRNEVPFRMLLVEDSRLNQLVIKTYLSELEILLDVAENGQVAVDMFKQNRYQFVIMDIQMPVMDGLEATRLIRNYEHENGWTPIPIVALTAHALAGDSEKTLKAGCTAHLPKPIKKKPFLDVIRSYLSPPLVNNWAHASNQTMLPIPIDVDPVLKPYIPIFLESMSRNVSLISDAIQTCDADKIRAIGHRMKGEGGTYGFHKITELGSMIQTASEKNQFDNIRELLNELMNYLGQIEIQ